MESTAGLTTDQWFVSAKVLRGFRNILKKDRSENHSTDHLQDKKSGERMWLPIAPPPPPPPPLWFWEQSVVNQTNTSTVLRVPLEKQPRDGGWDCQGLSQQHAIFKVNWKLETLCHTSQSLYKHTHPSLDVIHNYIPSSVSHQHCLATILPPWSWQAWGEFCVKTFIQLDRVKYCLIMTTGDLWFPLCSSWSSHIGTKHLWPSSGSLLTAVLEAIKQQTGCPKWEASCNLHTPCPTAKQKPS